MRIIMRCRTQYCTEQNFLSDPQTIIIAQMMSTGVEGVLDYKGLNSSKVSKLKTEDDRNRLTLIFAPILLQRAAMLALQALY